MDIERGVGLDGSPTVGADPQIELRNSRDNARTWSGWRPVSMGKIGEYTVQVRWRRLGRARDWTPEVRITDPVKVALVAAEADIQVGQA